MEFYQKALFALDLPEWEELKERIGDEEVVAALHDYIQAYVSYKSAFQEYESATCENEKELWRAYLKSTKEKKNRWTSLQSLLGEDDE
jgi:hypothetical protein